MEISDGLGDLKNQESPDYRNRAFEQKLVILKKLGKRKKTGKSEDLKKRQHTKNLATLCCEATYIAATKLEEVRLNV